VTTLKKTTFLTRLPSQFSLSTHLRGKNASETPGRLAGHARLMHNKVRVNHSTSKIVAFFHFSHLKSNDWKQLKSHLFSLDTQTRIRVIKNRLFSKHHYRLPKCYGKISKLRQDGSQDKKSHLQFQGPTCVCVFSSFQSFQVGYKSLEQRFNCLFLGAQIGEKRLKKLDVKYHSELEERTVGNTTVSLNLLSRINHASVLKRRLYCSLLIGKLPSYLQSKFLTLLKYTSLAHVSKAK
jgi:hypothetical protein